jgi:hypothetical protein
LRDAVDEDSPDPGEADAVALGVVIELGGKRGKMVAVVGVVALGLGDFATTISPRDSWLANVGADGGIWGELVESWGGIFGLFGAVVEIEFLTRESSDGRAGLFFSVCLCFRRFWLTLRVDNFFFSLTQEHQSRFQNSSKFLFVALGYRSWIFCHLLSFTSRSFSAPNMT